MKKLLLFILLLLGLCIIVVAQFDTRNPDGSIGFNVYPPGNIGVSNIFIYGPTSSVFYVNGTSLCPANFTVFTMTAAGSVTNITTTTNSLWGTGTGSRVLTNGFWQAGRTITCILEGEYFDGGTPGGNRFLVLLTTVTATNTLAQSYFTPPVSIAGEYFKIEAQLTCRTTGGSGTIDTTGTILTVAAGTPTIRAFTNSVTTLDTTIAYTLDIASTNGASTDSWQTRRGNIVLQ